MKNITSIYRKMYISAIILFVAILLLAHTKVEQKGRKDGFEVVHKYSYEHKNSAEYPIGMKTTYYIAQRNVKLDYRYLYFMSIHQNVEVYVDGQRVYSLKGTDGDLIWKTPGYQWNAIRLDEANNEKLIQVDIIPIYEETANLIPRFYLGTQYDIIKEIVDKDFAVIIICIFAFLSGIGLITVSFYRRKQDAVNSEIRSMHFLGIVSIVVSVWKLTVIDSAGFVAVNFPAVCMLSYWTLMAIPFPFLLTMRAMLEDEGNKWWNLPCVVSAVSITMVLAFQYFGIADMRQTLTITHISIGCAFVSTLILLIHNIIKKGFSKKMVSTIICAISCGLWAASDMISYIATDSMRMNSIGLMAFLLYICIIGFDSMQKARKVMLVGMQAKQYEKIAFIDALTGFYNRTSYLEYIGNETFQLEGCIVVAFDINNLKKCNDMFGHEKGDEYIKASARIIRECFGDIGQCYRMGGDEFSALVVGSSLEICKKRFEEMLEKVDEYNRTSQDIHMGIACGYSQYDASCDRDFEDTSKRADYEMYQHKFAMKAKEASEKQG